MKFIWEPDDIKVGRKYSRPDITEIWLIGYIPSVDSTGPRYVSISMEDGMVTGGLTANVLSAGLTRNNYVPVEFIAKLAMKK